MNHQSQRVAFLLLWLVFACGMTNAREQALVINDFTGRGFPPDLITYGLKGSGTNWDALRIFDTDGKQIPSQVRTNDADGERALQFVAALPADGSLNYTVRDSGGARVAGNVKIQKHGKDLVLGNSLFKLRVPGETNQTFNPPVPVATLPAPILAFENSSGQWLGASSILSQKKVKSFRVKLVQGTVCAELAYEILWADGGFYRARVQVIDQVPLAKVYGEYDTGKLDGGPFWELDLGVGWKPDHVETASHNGNGGGDSTGKLTPLAKFFERYKVYSLLSDQAWPPRLSHIGLFRKDAMNEADHPLVGVVPLRRGLWRRATTLEVVPGKDSQGVAVRFPMGVRDLNWIKDGSSETSPFATAEHDHSLSPTYGRRVWGLALGHPTIPNKTEHRPIYQLHRLYGIVGLDRYKDFILKWEPGGVTYPRLNRGTADADQKRCLQQLRRACAYLFTSFAHSHHGMCQYYNIAFAADRVLSKPDLSEEIRQEIRSRLALITYLYEDGDMMSYGTGYHHGNPNMGTARFWSGPCFAALIPDHPMAEAWTKHLLEYGAYNLATQIAPGGAYVEYGAAYHMHGFARTSNGLRGLAVLAGADAVKDLYTDYLNPCWQYYMNQLTPFESRWQSRVIPGMANSQPGNTKHLIEAAASVYPFDANLGRELAWAYQVNGQRKTNALLVDPAVKPKHTALASQYYPGLGIVFRAHQGEAETFMLIRSGFNWSHWYIDPGHFIMMSRGATLVPFQPFQYGNTSDRSFDPNNTIRFGDKNNQSPYGWPDSNILDYHFGSTVDYAWSSTGFPDWYIAPGQAPGWSKQLNVKDGARKLDSAYKQVPGAFDWDRQIIFMKGRTANSPNYFVIRDSTNGDGKLASYLNLRVLGTKERVNAKPDGFHIDTQWDTDLDIHFTRPVKADLHEDLFGIATHNCNITKRVKNASKVSPDWVKADGTPWESAPTSKMKERNTILRIAAPPEQGYTWVLYPRQANEAAPAIKDMGQGLIKVTHPEGTDYILLSSTPVTVKADDVKLSGRAAAVRISKDKVHLVLASGSGHAGYRGHIIKSDQAFEQTIPTSGLKPGVTVMSPAEDGDSRITTDGDAIRFVTTSRGYVKLTNGNHGVRGVGPFDLTFTNDRISGTLSGKKRSLVVSWPKGIKRPMFTLDGKRYFAGWADDPSINRSADSVQFSIAFAVTDGDHQIEISEWTYPALPVEPKRRLIDF